MAENQPASPENARTHQAFSFFAANGRLYASNIEQKLVDLGSLQQQPGGWAWLLDGNKLSGAGFPNPVDAMRDVVKNMSFLYLDGQFTALADVRQEPDVHLENAPQLNIVVDELQPDERMEDARV